MAKTYEAMLKNQISPKDNYLLPSTLSDWYCRDLKNDKQTGDLGQKIDLFCRDHKNKVFNFISSQEKEGVSTIIANLAKSMTRGKNGKQILVIDANLHNPVLHSAFDTPFDPGLRDVLMGCSYSEAIHNSQFDNIHIMPCGSPNYRGDICREKYIEIISSIKQQYDFILIDSSPILSSPDAMSSAIASDITFWVVQANRIRKQVAERVKTFLQRSNCLIGGVILNREQHVVPEWIYKRL